MNIEQKITALLAQAEPLRGSTDAYDGQALGDIVEQINALRAEQSRIGPVEPAPVAAVEGADAEPEPAKPEHGKRGPGRPRKGA